MEFPKISNSVIQSFDNIFSKKEYKLSLLAKQSNKTTAKYLYATNLIKQCNYKDASEILFQALNIKHNKKTNELILPSNFTSSLTSYMLNDLGMCLNKLGDLISAKKILHLAVDIYDNPWACYNLGYNYHKMYDDKSKAIKYFSLSVVKDDYYLSHYSLGIIFAMYVLESKNENTYKENMFKSSFHLNATILLLTNKKSIKRKYIKTIDAVLSFFANYNSYDKFLIYKQKQTHSYRIMKSFVQNI